MVDLRLADVPQVADHRHRHVGQGQLDELALAGAPPVPLGGEDRHRRHHSGDRVPRRQHVVDRVDRLVAVRRPGGEGDADGAVDGVVHRRGSVRVAEQVHHDQVGATLFQRFVAEPAGRREVGEEDSRAVAGLRDQRGDQLLAFRLAGVDGERALTLVQSDPVEAAALGGERPAPRVQPAFQWIETDDVGTLLRQRHSAKRSRDEG